MPPDCPMHHLHTLPPVRRACASSRAARPGPLPAQALPAAANGGDFTIRSEPPAGDTEEQYFETVPQVGWAGTQFRLRPPSPPWLRGREEPGLLLPPLGARALDLPPCGPSPRLLQGLASSDSSTAPRLGALIEGPKGKQVQQCTRCGRCGIRCAVGLAAHAACNLSLWVWERSL